MLLLQNLSSFGSVEQDVYQLRREAKERRIEEWAAACDAVRQARTDVAAAAAAAEQDMAIARSQQQYNRAKDRLTAAQAEQQRAAALKVGHAWSKCSSALGNLWASLDMLASLQWEYGACMLLQEPSEPQDPLEELAEPWYFTDPKLLGKELQSMDAANEAAAERLEVTLTSRCAE